MNNKFDELAKGLAQSATRRQALKKFGVGLAGMALACFGLASRTKARDVAKRCTRQCGRCGPGLEPCCKGLYCGLNGLCFAPGTYCAV
jgi:hypothetical protein